MFDLTSLEIVLNHYKEEFSQGWWLKEKYKWEAVKHFQDHWDVNAADFRSMLEESLGKTENLLASQNNFPRNMIVHFASRAPEEVRSMFIYLFDETKDVVERITWFKQQSDRLLQEHGDGRGSHYQSENSISTYLWLHFPDRYYIYKYSEVKSVAVTLGSDVHIKKGASAENVRNSILLYDSICRALQQDEELVTLLKSNLADNCYPDEALRTLTIDIGYYISRRYSKQNAGKSNDWFPADYSPEISVDDWVLLLNKNAVFDINSLEVMKRMKDYGGMATCSELAGKYGNTYNFYNNVSVGLAKRVQKETNCPVPPLNSEKSRWWPILYVGRYADNKVSGFYIWKLRDELSEALDKVDLSEVPLYVDSDQEVESVPMEETVFSDTDDRNYWWLNANPRIWSFSGLGVGQTVAFTLYNESGNKRRVFQNFLDAKPGDLVLGYESNPVKQIIALCEVVTSQDGKQLIFRKTEALSVPIKYSDLKSLSELAHMEFFANPNGSFFKLTRDEYDFIIDLIRQENPVAESGKLREKYSKEQFLDEVFMTENKYDALVSVLNRKKNIILQGAPGVGKTFAAKRLAYSMMGEKDDDRIEFVQFHQNYSYEDMVMGYKPVGNTFELKDGVFYRFCLKAMSHPEKDHYFIIDEINRGNLSKIFGELLMMIESEYRDVKMTLAYSDILFAVPGNVYIIGLMNTADRSLAMIDYALRRRFSFFEMVPGFDSEGFIKYQRQFENETMDDLISKIQKLNAEIINDKSLGRGFCIGHSFFCECKEFSEEWLRAVVDYDILPTLNEYWFDDSEKYKLWENELLGAFQ